MADETVQAAPPDGSQETWRPGRAGAALLSIAAALVAAYFTAIFSFYVYAVESRNCTPGARAWDSEITIYAGAAVLVAFAWTTVGTLLRIAIGRPGFRGRAWALVAVLAVAASCTHARYGAETNPSLAFCSQMDMS